MLEAEPAKLSLEEIEQLASRRNKPFNNRLFGSFLSAPSSKSAFLQIASCFRSEPCLVCSLLDALHLRPNLDDLDKKQKVSRTAPFRVCLCLFADSNLYPISTTAL